VLLQILGHVLVCVWDALRVDRWLRRHVGTGWAIAASWLASSRGASDGGADDPLAGAGDDTVDAEDD